MMPIRTFATLSVASLLGSCAVGPDYQGPEFSMPGSYLGQVEAGPVAAVANADHLAWWQEFQDQQLTGFVALALEQNLDLAQAAARVDQARAGLGAANAALLPSGSISSQAARVRQSIESPLGQVLNAIPDFDRYGTNLDANLGASWELDVFGGLRRDREAALAAYQASAAGAMATRLTVAAQTADIYISIRGLQTRLDLAHRRVQTQQELLALINLLHDKGLAAGLQVHQAEGALAQVKASMPGLEAGLDVAMNALDVMLGTPPGTHRSELGTVHTIPATPTITTMGTPGDLLRRRPDLIVAERRLAAAHAGIGAAIAGHYPRLSLSGLIGSATARSGANLFTSDASQAAGVLGLQWRLFDFARINAEIDLARGRRAEMLSAYKLAALRATEDVESALSTLLKREAQAGLLAEGVASLSRARDESFAAYQSGVVSRIEVLQADDDLLRASDAQAQAQTESARAAVTLFKALGGGWQPGEPVVMAIK